MKHFTILKIGLLASISQAAVIIHSDDFTTSSSAWGTPTGGSASSSTVTYDATDENYDLTASHIDNPNPAGGSDVFYSYQVSGLDFGLGPVEVSFDGLLGGGLPGTAIHVRINGNFFAVIQGSFNTSSSATYSQTLALTDGFDATDTLTLQFQFAMGAVGGAGGLLTVDNISVATEPTMVPEPSTFLLTGLAGLTLLRRRRA